MKRKKVKSILKNIDTAKMAYEKYPITEAGYIGNHSRRNDFEEGLKAAIETIETQLWQKEHSK